MSLILFFDTETTGLPDFKAPSDAEHQPHIVQLAASLVEEDTRRSVASIDLIVQPDCWTIPDDVAAIHGITTERALAQGVPEGFAVEALLRLWHLCERRVAHNEQFDARILRIGFKRHADETLADEWKAGAAECTARMATPICNLPPTAKMVAANLNKPKTPNLGEAYRHFFGEDFADAHSARADVNACIAVYFAVQDHLARAAA